MRKVKRVKIGDYVLVSRWPDHDPNDPWEVGFITEFGEDTTGTYYRVKDRYFRNVWKISPEEGKRICDEYPSLEITKPPTVETA